MTFFPCRGGRRYRLAGAAALMFGALPAEADMPFAVGAATIAGVQDAFAAGELTCVELTDHYLARIAAYDDRGPKLNAILSLNPEARALAARMDASYRADPEGIGPLHCVPVIVKDNYDTADMPTTGASVALRDSTPPRDAFTIAKLRAAGALILAKSNLTEFAMGGTTISSLGGQTLNPFDLTRTPGGSSGGTGAALAADFGLVGTGSDTGQSIRSPASAQSLVGIRATRGLISRRGVIPLSTTQDEAGPITQSVEDAARMLDVMAGYDPEDPITALGHGRVPESYADDLDGNGLEGARIDVLRDLFGTEPVHAEVNRVTDLAIDAMTDLGAEPIDISIPDLKRLTTEMGLSSYETKPGLNAYLASLGEGAPVATLDELIAGGDYHPAIEASLEAAQDEENGPASPEYAAVFVRRDALRKAVMAAMAEHDLDAILYPHQRRLVAKVGVMQLERNGVLSNSTGFPAVTFPGGFSRPDDDAPLGVPIGIELLGPEWSEETLLRYAYAFEQGAKRRKPPRSTPALATAN